MIDLKKLKRMTEQAVERGKKEAEENERRQEERDKRKKAAIKRKAQNIIEQIPERAEREAAEGRNHAIVMNVRSEDCERPFSSRDFSQCSQYWLRGAAELVYQYCEEAKLNPTLEYWHDGVGINSGHNIVIHW